MSESVEQKTRVVDYFTLMLAIASVIAGIVGFYHFKEQSELYSIASVVAAIILSLGLVYLTGVGKKAWGYMRASRMELRKVVWPTRQETFQTLIMVSVFTGVLSLYLLLCDKFASLGIEWLVPRG